MSATGNAEGVPHDEQKLSFIVYSRIIRVVMQPFLSIGTVLSSDF